MSAYPGYGVSEQSVCSGKRHWSNVPRGQSAEIVQPLNGTGYEAAAGEQGEQFDDLIVI